ncbi:universal stress protein [Ramlibacter tataouinensis]|uniref:universal stress protein n=1 Tax=Ramlibacter tataouinensis TaxID=94132 RepID=UPI0022F3C029|nr:universal stress protein [Ramlibacter tataouinensis]WBY00450.1 universal stress protein [Ramlibacter tataouinensis]
MAQVLLPIDGHGPQAQRALAEAIRIHRREEVPVYLLSVQPLVSGHVAAFFGPGELARLQHDAGLEELEPARALLQAAGVWHRLVVRVGRRAETIARTAQELGCDRIILGDAGDSAGGWLGTMAEQVRHLLAGTRGCQVI